jgi:4-alpha-glucanotransferase
MKFERSSGIILHPTSLPGPYGIGDLGPQAYRWIDFLAGAGCNLWQVLPLGPTGYGDSPYQCFSAFAGNAYLVSPDLLIKDGLLFPEDLMALPKFPAERVDYGPVIQWKLAILDRTFEHFEESATNKLRKEYHEFQIQHAGWLEDFALFMALKDTHGGQPWPTWEPDLRDREEKALKNARKSLAKSIQQHTFRQFLFFRQWQALREYAYQKNIRIIGDAPIFVAHDSTDVWANPGLFALDAEGRPRVQAGVPPDYFSATGQLWGNPLYTWKVHRASNYHWWVERIRATLRLVDIIRLDHFRGFAGYWQVPGKAKTAIKGRWVKGPGKHFLRVLRQELGDLPLIAEDLGVITKDVVDLRDSFGLPGMKILQFAFEGEPTDPFLPHNYPTHCVVYTGTHDNDTALGWYERVAEKNKDFYRRYLGRDGKDVSWDMIRGCWSSVAVFALAPLQDFLSLDNTARMNYPGNPSGNWGWRLPAGALSSSLQARIKEFNFLYDRTRKEADSEA